ncbi:MAG: 2-C-methyl-D-erythritol 2,4-cyclodiphosphate synthase [Phycisphaerales bacterium]
MVPKAKPRAARGARPPTALEPRVGHGYDLHRLEAVAPAGAGRPMILGGVKIPESPVGPVGHSDGDVLYHCVTDALLGALGLPDIGQLFPDTDPRHDGRDSAEFLTEAVKRVREAGYRVGNLDVTVIAERPKLGPIKQQVRGNLARLLGVEVARVNVKGKTHEKVDAVGEGRAIECHAVVLLAPAR